MSTHIYLKTWARKSAAHRVWRAMLHILVRFFIQEMSMNLESCGVS